MGSSCLQNQSKKALEEEVEVSTHDLAMIARPGGVLELAEQSLEFRQHLE